MKRLAKRTLWYYQHSLHLSHSEICSSKVADPLGEATKYVNKLRTSSPDKLESYLLAFSVFFARKKYLLALQAVKHSLVLCADHPQVHRNLVSFFTQVSKEQALTEIVTNVINIEKATLVSSSLSEYNTAFRDQHLGSLPHRVAGEPNK